jgi:putative DNA primase/helicase
VQYNSTGGASKLDACEIAAALGGPLVADAHGNFLCRCPAHNDQNPSLSVRDYNGKALVHCFAGCRQIDVIAALQRLGLLSGSPEPGARTPAPVQHPGPSSDPFKMWRKASPLPPVIVAAPLVSGSLVETYLRNRGLESPSDAPLRYAPSLWHWPSRSRHPAMVALVTRHDGEPVTSHATFLSDDGRKAAIEPPRLFPSGASPAGAGVWFDGLGSKRELIIAEGIESALSAAKLNDALAAVATLSTHGMRNLILPLAMRLTVRIFADHDRAGHGLAAARDLYRRLHSEGREVVITMPNRVGDDANDIWLRRVTGR